MPSKRANLRSVTGILLLDKPEGLSSNQALQEVKHLYRARKAGHTGSLDPIATGLLPLCFGQATKVSQFLLNADKHYRVTARLGVRTDTGDREGKLLAERAIPRLDERRVGKVLAGFRGEISQIPPMYSARKHKGERLYKLAREGIEVEREARQITVFRLDLMELSGADLLLDIACSKGTYVRTLVEDIGEELGCGAHVTALRRLGVEPYIGRPMYTTAELKAHFESAGWGGLDALLLPLDSALEHLPAVKLGEDAAFYLRQGQPVLVPRAPAGGELRLYSADRFLGVGEVIPDGRVAPRRLLARGGR